MKKLIHLLSALIILSFDNQDIENSDESLQKCNVTLTEVINLGKPHYNIILEYDNQHNLVNYQEINSDKTKRNTITYTETEGELAFLRFLTNLA